MVLQEAAGVPRINARESDVFDIFNLKHYLGPNPYLNTAAFTFDFALTQCPQPLPIDVYLSKVCFHFPQLQEGSYPSYAHLFARLVAEVNRLQMDLHLQRWSCHPFSEYVRIAVQTLHGRTTRAAVYFAWDWLEAIAQGQPFDFEGEMRRLQQLFRDSVYGGPTVYALLRAAHERGIPTYYLWDEGVMQYGYGRNQVRGVATTFHCDSHLDSDFTTRKDDCKAFLAAQGFPVPQGEVVASLAEALQLAQEIGYPVVLKPVAGHKGMGVTAGIQTPEELAFAYEVAVAALSPEEPIRLILEKHLQGTDFRLLCVGGRFVAATERRPASVTGDGRSTIGQLIEQANRDPARWDTPTSPLGPIQWDEAMERFLAEQGLTVDSVLEPGRTVYLRKVSNLSAGGVSRDVTATVHPDNVVLAQTIAQQFSLVCLGIDVIAPSLERSWKEGSLGIIEINAAPGVLMHQKPAIGAGVDVPGAILDHLFPKTARIPILTFNRLTLAEAHTLVEHILSHRPNACVGSVCREGVLLNHSFRPLQGSLFRQVKTLLRHPQLDLLLAEADEETLEREGLAYEGSDLVVLRDPSDQELKTLKRDLNPGGALFLQRGSTLTLTVAGQAERFELPGTDLQMGILLRSMTLRIICRTISQMLKNWSG
jgi:cyanophycin synthetase